MKSFYPGRPGPLVSLLVLAAVLTAGMVHKAIAADFKPPEMAGFSLHDQRDGDGDGDGVNETHIMHYLNPAGDSIVSMSTKGVLWAWSLDTRDSDSATVNYVIRDSNCDGVFDEVYGLDEEFHVPDCLK